MRKGVIGIVGLLLGLIMLPATAFAANGDLELLSGSARFVPENPTQGRSTRIYATIKNNSKDDLYGTVKFYNKTRETAIGSDQPISVIAGKTDDVFVNWNPTAGRQIIEVSIVPWQKGDNSANNSYSISINVLGDLDGDGIPDSTDPDIDGDGVPNVQDAFPLDPKEWKDTDGDSIGDNSDPDIDGDGLTNDQERKLGTDPTNPDTDGDGVSDGKDAFPLDPKEWKDTNHNGIGDNKDPDIDGDGIPNAKDPFPANLPPIIKVTPSQDIPLIVPVGKPLKLNADPSFDTDGKITEITWTVDPNGENGNVKKTYVGPRPTITIDQPGNHTIELSVKDNSGETKKKSWTTFGAASVFSSQGGIATVLIALALLALIYYSTKAFRKDSSKGDQSQKH